MHALFADFKATYDSVENCLWKIMTEVGILGKSVTKPCTHDPKWRVLIQGEVSEAFNIRTGFLEGDGLSPMLFNLALEMVIRTIFNTWQCRGAHRDKL